MSKLGKKPITIPKDAKVKLENGKLILTGPKGSKELSLNDKMLIYGQDVAGDKGGVFTATKGLTNKFGKNRVFNSPLARLWV